MNFFSVLVIAVASALPAWSAELTTVPVYSVAEIRFQGPRQAARDVPARDVAFSVRFRHESGAPEFLVQGFFDGDGAGNIEGDVFMVRFCPTRAGRWNLVQVASNKAPLAGQREGDHVTATESRLHGFWIPDAESAGGRWYRRSDGTHPYIFGNTHYTFVTGQGLDGRPSGGSIAADMKANAEFFKKVRFGLQNDRYPHPSEKPWLDESGTPTDDGGFSHRPNPRWFHQRIDVAVRSAFDHDLIADLILNGPDVVESRSVLKAAHNGGDATPCLRYIAARYGSFPNAWICLSNEYDIKKPNYTQEEIAALGVALRGFLPYPMPVSVHDGSKIGWSAKFDALPSWADHQIIQKKVRTIAAAADAIDFVARGGTGDRPRRKPTINDELSYQGAGDNHSEGDTIESHLGAFLGGGYASTGEKRANKVGQYFWGAFDPTVHTAARSLGWLRGIIDRDISFWKLEPGAKEFENLDSKFRAMAWPGHEYVLGTDGPRSAIAIQLPPGRWRVMQHDAMARESVELAARVTGRFVFNAPAGRAVLFHFKREGAEDSAVPVHREN